jgi:hypothetical protein
MTGVSSCARCGEPLVLPVRFCPFCGARQDIEATDPMPAPTLEPVDAIRPVPDMRDDHTDADATPPLDAGGRHRLPPTVPFPRPIAPQHPIRGAASRSQSPSRAVAARSARRNPGRAGAIRKLLAAVFVLGCAAVLWQQLVAVPHGTLLVHLADPVDGRILVDGIASGAPDQAISVAPGRHRIGLDAVGVETRQRTVSVRADETVRLALFPPARPATLSLDSDPAGAAISLDGHPIGRTPLRRTVPPGRHRIVASLPGFEPLSREIVLGPGDSTPLQLPLQPVPLRRVAAEAPPGRWSEPVQPGDGVRFTLLFSQPIRVRIAGRVLLLEPGAPVALGTADASGIAFTAVGDAPVPVRLVITPASSEGAP